MIKKIIKIQGKMFLSVPITALAIATILNIIFCLISALTTSGETAKNSLVLFNNISRIIIIVSVLYITIAAIFLEFNDTLFEMTEVKIKQRIYAKLITIFCEVTLICLILILETTFLDLIVSHKFLLFRNTITLDNLIFSMNFRSIWSWFLPVSIAMFSLILYTMVLPAIRIIKKKNGIISIILAIFVSITIIYLQYTLLTIEMPRFIFGNLNNTVMGYLLPLNSLFTFESNTLYKFIFIAPIFNIMYLLISSLVIALSVFLSIKVTESIENE